LVEQRPEKNARLRFLSADEELRLREAITKRCPQHMPELDIGLNTGMRKGEQYSLEWPQISFRRKRILLEETKNGSSREIPMNKSCIAAMEVLFEGRPHEGRVCQSKYGKDLNDSRSWFDLCIKDAGDSELHMALSPPHVHQSTGHGGSGPENSPGTGGTQDDLNDGSIRAPGART
jgi:integrase